MAMNPRLLRPLATSRYAALRSGLLGYWPMNEDAPSGDVTAADVSGKKNDFTSNNSVLSTTGKVGNARQFVAANSEYLSVTSSDFILGDANAWTIALWFNVPTAAPNTHMIILGKDESGSRQFALNFNLDASAVNVTDVCSFSHWASGLNYIAAFSGTVSRGAWHLFTATHAANATTISLTLDRTSTATVTRGAAAFNGFTSAMNVGRRAFSGFHQYASASVDELAIWERVLSSSELDTLWNSGTGIDLRK